MAKMEWYDWLMIVLMTVGAINWGLVGAFDFNLVEWIFGQGWFTNLLYILVGVSGIVGIIRLAMKK
jgi:uncharacterized membrane protein YuzA (DUF378 family)